MNKDNSRTSKRLSNKKYQLDSFETTNNYNYKNNTNNIIKIKQDNYKIKKVNTIGGRFSIKTDELKNLNDTRYFLKEFNDDNNRILISFLKLIQIHMDIELILDNCINNNMRRRISTPNNDKIYKFNSLINNYFNTLSLLKKFNQIQDNNGNNESKNNKNGQDDNSNSFLYQKYNIFNYTLINTLFHKCIKLQICYYAVFMVCLSHLSYDDIDSIIQNNFSKIIKEISKPLYTIFRIFIMNELKDKYNKILLNNIRPNFFDNLNKLHLEDRKLYSLKKNELLKIISNDINKCADSLKSYSNYNLRNSLIKPFGDAFNQMLFKLDRITLNKFIYIFLNTILYGELEVNKQKMRKNLESSNINISKYKYNNKINYYGGSAKYNNINEVAPLLPEINPKYKYTLVLDIDETLVHFFLTSMYGMFFVRPYCFEFLNELNKYYEIVTFTNGMKNYADYILNLLDINDNIIKYRLYRQHVSVAGFSRFKNLNLLGRDLKKTIIIDNLKENFTLQPDNGLYIKSWTSDVNDTQFIDLLNILKSIAINNVEDVRLVIQIINDKIKYIDDIINPYSKLNIKKIIEDVNNTY